jgi:SAM-dependent methyltransferase
MIGSSIKTGQLDGNRLVVGCVADNSNKYLSQALRLLQSWRWFAGALADSEFHICVVDNVPPAYQEQYESYGGHVHIVPRFSEAHPPSNKLRFLELPCLSHAERVVLLDCDTLIVQEPLDLISQADFIAKIADFPTVTPEVFRTLFSTFKLPLPVATERCTVHGEPIIPYFNAGVLSFSQKAMTSLVPEWIRINRCLIEHLNLLQSCSNFCEQASLSLALAACGTSFETLSNQLNFPAHCLHEPLDSDFGRTDPAIIHYHSLVDENGLLKSSPYPNVSVRIESFNTRLGHERRRHFDNRFFWDKRYAQNPVLGSGVGSRGQVASYKRGLLERIVAEHKHSTILDIGCGDMFVSEVLPEQGYTGVDVSSVVIELNSAKYSQRKFIRGDFASMELGKYHLLLCLDLLIHIPDKDRYCKFVSKCIDATISFGIIAAYEDPPEITSEITFFHEPISKTLTAAGAVNVREIGSYNQVRVFQFEKRTDFMLAEARLAEPLLKRPIFLVGTMRSGTTLLADLLGSSPHIAHCPFELKDIWSQQTGIPMASPKTGDHECPECGAADVVPGMRESLTAAFLNRMSGLENKALNPVFLNKNPHLCNKLDLVRTLFPDARFIWVHRHLPQVVASIKRLFSDVNRRQSTWHWWPLPSDHTRNRCWNAYYDPDHLSGISSDRIFPGGNIGYLAEYWLESNRAIADFCSNLSRAEWTVASEEAVLAAPSIQLSRLYGFLQVPFFDVALEELDGLRNAQWKGLLDFTELSELREFVAERGHEINAIFAGEDRQAFYLRQLDEALHATEQEK